MGKRRRLRATKVFHSTVGSMHQMIEENSDVHLSKNSVGRMVLQDEILTIHFKLDIKNKKIKNKK